VKLFRHELRNQQRLFWRNRESAIFVFVFPPMLFLLLGAVYTGNSEGFKLADHLLVGLIGYGCANTAFAGLAITLVIRRESGVLKRIRATPLPTVTYLSAVLVSTLWVFVLQTLVTIGLGLSLYGAKGPENWLGMIPAVLVGVACFAGMGFGITALIRSAEGASAVVNLIVLPMAFLSGSFGPTRKYPEVLRWLADLLPLTYLIRLLKDVYLRGGSFFGHPKEIAILLAWGLLGVIIAWRRFGWEPREQ
jgi:ABC-2 type transport system permease protein